MDAETFREALAYWATAVTVVSVRDGDNVIGMTVGSFTSVSADPPTILFSLGPNARVLPYLEEGEEVAVSLLGEGQRRLAANFADSFQIGPSPFVQSGAPVVADAVAALACTVRSIEPAPGGSTIVLAEVADADLQPGRPLLYHRRRYHELSREE